MDEMALLRRAGSEFERRLAGVTPDQLSRPTPCAEWTVRDLISHVVGESIMSVRLLHGADAKEAMVGLDGDILGADAPLPSPRRRRPSTRPLRSPAPRSGSSIIRPWICPGPSYSGSESAASRCTHGTWPAAAGGDETLDSELVEAVWAQLSPMTPFIAQTGVFGAGPSGKIGQDAPLQVRLLDLTGRRPG